MAALVFRWQRLVFAAMLLLVAELPRQHCVTETLKGFFDMIKPKPPFSAPPISTTPAPVDPNCTHEEVQKNGTKMKETTCLVCNPNCANVTTHVPIAPAPAPVPTPSTFDIFLFSMGDDYPYQCKCIKDASVPEDGYGVCKGDIDKQRCKILPGGAERAARPNLLAVAIGLAALATTTWSTEKTTWDAQRSARPTSSRAIRA
eukprot:TRINITY_DN37629_c0_g1_i1.p1 TRINITY_DN37629_c0_g1~~TRINITY_DN37629_c0_g1_i1.p1  ORF type:complete len:202 (+),score=32.75 TRINITY_DN37629_c0_g1_i1:155-760(+)